jgi:hypothetical protein
MDTAWSSTDPALVVTAEPLAPYGAGASSNRLRADSGAIFADARFDPVAPIDLSAFDELRFWIFANRAADGSAAAPYYLEFFYIDASAPGVEHRWMVPVNRADQWEQRIIGLRPVDPRGQVSRLAFRARFNFPFSCYVDELLAVREEMLADAEQALIDAVQQDIPLAGVAAIPTTTIPQPGDTQVIVAFSPALAADNLVRLRGGSGGDELFHVAIVTHAPPNTTLAFVGGETVTGTFAANGTVSVVVPAIVPTLLTPLPTTQPAVVVTMLDAREDLERTECFFQRDSFRVQGLLTLCSVRPAPRAYTLDYSLNVRARDRVHQIAVTNALLQRFSLDVGLRINGAVAPVWMLAPPPLFMRRLDELSPVYARIGTHRQVAERVEQTWVQHAAVVAAPLEAPSDQEEVGIDL